MSENNYVASSDQTGQDRKPELPEAWRRFLEAVKQHFSDDHAHE